MSEKGKITRGRLGSLSLKKEGERQCFLFSKHLIVCTRGSGGKLHLTKVGARRSWPGPRAKGEDRLCVHGHPPPLPREGRDFGRGPGRVR